MTKRELLRGGPHFAPMWVQDKARRVPHHCPSSWQRSMDQLAPISRCRLLQSTAVSDLCTSKCVISRQIPCFQSAGQGDTWAAMGMCVHVPPKAILPGTGDERTPTWLQAAFNYPEPRFQEILSAKRTKSLWISWHEAMCCCTRAGLGP